MAQETPSRTAFIHPGLITEALYALPVFLQLVSDGRKLDWVTRPCLTPLLRFLRNDCNIDFQIKEKPHSRPYIEGEIYGLDWFVRAKEHWQRVLPEYKECISLGGKTMHDKPAIEAIYEAQFGEKLLSWPWPLFKPSNGISTEAFILVTEEAERPERCIPGLAEFVRRANPSLPVEVVSNADTVEYRLRRCASATLTIGPCTFEPLATHMMGNKSVMVHTATDMKVHGQNGHENLYYNAGIIENLKWLLFSLS